MNVSRQIPHLNVHPKVPDSRVQQTNVDEVEMVNFVCLSGYHSTWGKGKSTCDVEGQKNFATEVRV